MFRFINSPASKHELVNAWTKVLKGGNLEEMRAEAEYEWNFFQRYKPYDSNLLLSPERIAYMQKLNVEIGIQKKILPYDQAVDTSLARDALKRIA